MTEFIITRDEVGRRLDVVLAARLGLSRSQAAGRIKSGLVTVSGALAKSSLPVEAGWQVTVRESDLPATTIPPDLPVVYEDADLMVIDKPVGLLVHAGAGRREATVADFARRLVQDDDRDRPGIVHRLDRQTSGLLIIAKTRDAKAYLQSIFKERQVHKTYLVLVAGHPNPETAKIDLPLDRSVAARVRRAVHPSGRPAVTVYRTRQNYTGFALLEAEPQTGRTHQIRAHLAAIGHPVAGDHLYGAPAGPPGLGRQFLHATHLRFTGPSGQGIDVASPLPADLQMVLDRLGKGVY
jgi:23S rRNA pseudouridine1911/1915/1917 synthase